MQHKRPLSACSLSTEKPFYLVFDCVSLPSYFTEGGKEGENGRRKGGEEEERDGEAKKETENKGRTSQI